LPTSSSLDLLAVLVGEVAERLVGERELVADVDVAGGQPWELTFRVLRLLLLDVEEILVDVLAHELDRLSRPRRRAAGDPPFDLGDPRLDRNGLADVGAVLVVGPEEGGELFGDAASQELPSRGSVLFLR
jgi:hypothetical protein